MRIHIVKKLKEKHNIQTTVSLLEGPNIVNILSRNNDKVILSVHNFQSEERKGIYGKIFKVLIKSLYNKSDKVPAVKSARTKCWQKSQMHARLLPAGSCFSFSHSYPFPLTKASFR